MGEAGFRALAALILFTGVGISTYYRRKADVATGETVSRRADGTVTMLLIRIGGLFLWFTPLAYIVNPQWLAWSRMGWPDAVRWLGVAAGLACAGAIYWLFSSIGTGITATAATRANHVLSTRGPYRWIRHPLYTFGASWFVSLGVIADSWAIAMLGALAFVGMALRTPREEAQLVEKFGDEYRTYMARTGRFFPRLSLPR